MPLPWLVIRAAWLIVILYWIAAWRWSALQGKRTDRISEAIAALHGAEAVSVVWDEKKPK